MSRGRFKYGLTAHLLLNDVESQRSPALERPSTSIWRAKAMQRTKTLSG